MSSFPRLASGAAILAVATVAGLISYQHIEDLTLALHQTILAARLMPFGVDGLITVGSVVLIQGGKLGWLGVGPGVAISLFANVESGIRYGALAAVWAGIPAVSFALACFIFERWLQSQHTKPGDSPAHVAVPVTVPVAALVPDTVATASVTDLTNALNVDVLDDIPPVPEYLAAQKPVRVPDTPVPVTFQAPPAVTEHVPVKHTNGQAKHVSVPDDEAGTLRDVFAEELSTGTVPGIREIKARARVGTPRAQQIQRLLSREVAVA